MNDPQNPARPVDASSPYATLYQLLSAAFASPDPELASALTGGDLANAVDRCAIQLEKQSLQAAAADFRRAVTGYAETLNFEQLQSEYIALFELNRNQPALHLNAHLYGAGKPEPVPVYQRLISSYRKFGIEPREDAAVEQPDHLTVQLEFMAWLYELRGQSMRTGTDYSIDELENAIDAFRADLAWVRNWLTALEQRGGHPLYVALGHLLLALLESD